MMRKILPIYTAICATMNVSRNLYKNLWGYGLGLTLFSPVGPLEFVWSIGPKSFSESNRKQFLFSFNAGYKF